MDRESAFMRSRMQKSEYCSIGSAHCLILWDGGPSTAAPRQPAVSVCALAPRDRDSRNRPLNLAGDEQGLLVLVGGLLQADREAIVVVRQHGRHIPAWICMRHTPSPQRISARQSARAEPAKDMGAGAGRTWERAREGHGSGRGKDMGAGVGSTWVRTCSAVPSAVPCPVRAYPAR